MPSRDVSSKGNHELALVCLKSGGSIGLLKSLSSRIFKDGWCVPYVTLGMLKTQLSPLYEPGGLSTDYQ